MTDPRQQLALGPDSLVGIHHGLTQCCTAQLHGLLRPLLFLLLGRHELGLHGGDGREAAVDWRTVAYRSTKVIRSLKMTATWTYSSVSPDTDR